MYSARKECRTCRFCGYPQKGCMAAGGMPRYMPEDGCPLYAMSAKAFMESVLHAQRRIAGMQERADMFREMATSVGGGIVHGGQSGGFVESCIEKHVQAFMDVCGDIEKEIAVLRARMRDVSEAISCLPDVKERELLELRYLNGQKWADIAKRLGVEERQLRRLHDKALENIQRDMDLIEYARRRPGWNPGGAQAQAQAVQ